MRCQTSLLLEALKFNPWMRGGLVEWMINSVLFCDFRAVKSLRLGRVSLLESSFKRKGYNVCIWMYIRM